MTMTSSRVRAVAALTLAFGLGAALLASDPPSGGKDWPMWGGTPDRNMVSAMKGLPATWDVKTKQNVKWVADLGSQSYATRSSPAGWCSSAPTTSSYATRTRAATAAC
jgi:hypothetical protein